MTDIYPLVILGIGIVAIVSMITILRLNAFISLITSAIIVSLLAPGSLAEKISRVAEAFGSAAGKIGIVIALAVVIGKCMMDSGAADRIVRAFLRLLGEKRVSIALMSSGFVLSIPVFFDTVFYLLVPLARSTYKRTGTHYVRYICAITTGAIVTHSLVPPTPGPLVMAENLGIDLGVMILMGGIVALPAAICGLLYGFWCDKRMNLPMRPLSGSESEPELLDESQLPPLWLSVLPIVLPVAMVSLNTIFSTLAKGAAGTSPVARLAGMAAVIGNVNLAMLVSTAVAMITLHQQRHLNRQQMSHVVEISLMSGGIIILITAAGGAFGAMLKAAEIGPAIERLVATRTGQSLSGLTLLCMGFIISAVLKIAQGSTTVAMITTSAMVAPMVGSDGSIGFHPVYLAMAIGSGGMVGAWMNDSGFWIFAKMGGFTEGETLQSWTALLVTTGITGLVATIILAMILPLA
ncbi:MAG: GntP family permease [Sedimentisphaerales bacterium]